MLKFLEITKKILCSENIFYLINTRDCATEVNEFNL